MTVVTKVVVGNARGPRGFPSGPLGAGSVDAETISDDRDDKLAILDKLYLMARTARSVEEYASVQASIDALPAAGGGINLLGPSYNFSDDLDYGLKSVFLNIGPDTDFTDARPYFETNNNCFPIGPYFRSQARPNAAPGHAGFVFGIEAIQPSDLNEGMGALFLGAQANAPGGSSINTCLNAVATANAGSSGNVWGIEVDVANFGPSGTGTQFGIAINGLGGNDVTFAIKVDRADPISKYLYGVDIRHSRVGIFVEPTDALENGLVLGMVGSQRFSGAMFQAAQIANGGAVAILQRQTNTSPTGDFLLCLNADNSIALAGIDISGNIYGNTVTAQSIIARGTAAIVPAGVVAFGGQTAGTAGAAAGEYLIVNVGGTPRKIQLLAA